LAERLGGRAIFLQFVNAALMNKVGVAVATLVAVLGFWIAVPLRKESVIALTIFILVAMIAVWVGAFDQAIATFESIKPLVELGLEAVSRMSFKELVILTGTTDLSGFFRVIHWADIWGVYSSSSFGTLLFGYGIGRTPDLTILKLVPHNECLRILAEYGSLNLDRVCWTPGPVPLPAGFGWYHCLTASRTGLLKIVNLSINATDSFGLGSNQHAVQLI
jgi:hypothetical protein